mgnify:CR=1 FL=1
MCIRDSFKYAVANMANACEAVIERNHLSKDDIDWVIPHQANQRIIDFAVKKLGIDPAVMASPFITTIVDALSLLIYFFFATWILPL